MLINKIRMVIPLSALTLLSACGEFPSPWPTPHPILDLLSAHRPAPTPAPAPAPPPAAVQVPPGTNAPAAQASRFLGQASFGATSATINNVVQVGTRSWIESQFLKPQRLHRDYVTRIIPTLPAGANPGPYPVFESFWMQAATGEDQLRQRVTYALSQIFVISTRNDFLRQHAVMVAGFYDTLASNSFGNFRSLLEAVSLHPAMGIYLNSLRNRKEDASRAPDENYAREIMQLMSIGLVELNPDGTQKKANGAPIETYSNADVAGLAKVFTGWSWAGPDKTNGRFLGANVLTHDPDRDWKPMQSYPQFHSTSQKSFLNVTVPAQAVADPEASLKIALDRLFNHPNVGPFIGKQLIQRLVVSNPSPAYVARVSAAFANNGQGVRGDMKAVIRAVLLDPEAQSEIRLTATDNGKLREPILRLAGWMRAFGASSASGRFLLKGMDDPSVSLGQSPLSSPSVFNFYRPGYVPPNSPIAAAGLVAPEMQLVSNISTAGYLNSMQDIIASGVGTDRDVSSNYSAEIALADQPADLVNRVNLLLLANQMTPALRNQLLAAINAIKISATDAAAATRARKERVQLAIFLTMASTEYLIQK